MCLLRSGHLKVSALNNIKQLRASTKLANRFWHGASGSPSSVTQGSGGRITQTHSVIRAGMILFLSHRVPSSKQQKFTKCAEV